MSKNRPCLGCLFFLQLLYQLSQIFVQTTVALDLVTSYRFLLLSERILGVGGVLETSFLVLLVLTFLLSLFAKSRSPFISFVFDALSYALMVVRVFELSGVIIALHHTYNGWASQKEDALLKLALISSFFLLFNSLILLLIKPR